MISKRHEAIGVKQVIHLEWMRKAANLLLAGLDANAIREELHKFLSKQRGCGSDGKCSDITRIFAVNNLMNIWVSPVPDLVPFRDASLIFMRKYPLRNLAIHWGMISAAYPFWFNVARQTGRLLALQGQATHAQVINRLKEQYGDRQTVSRCARYIIRSFVDWGVLKDSVDKGCYEKSAPVSVSDCDLAILIFESALHANSEAKCTLDLLLNNPAFFPFRFPTLTGGLISQHNDRIDVIRHGLDHSLLKLKPISNSH